MSTNSYHVAPTGLQAQTELGTFDNAGTLVGWGRNGWGEEPYGDSFNSLVQPAGVSATSSVGSLTSAIENFVYNRSTSNFCSRWFNFSFTSVVIPTGVRATSNVGDLSYSRNCWINWSWNDIYSRWYNS